MRKKYLKTFIIKKIIVFFYQTLISMINDLYNPYIIQKKNSGSFDNFLLNNQKIIFEQRKKFCYNL